MKSLWLVGDRRLDKPIDMYNDQNLFADWVSDVSFLLKKFSILGEFWMSIFNLAHHSTTFVLIQKPEIFL